MVGSNSDPESSLNSITPPIYKSLLYASRIITFNPRSWLLALFC